MSTQKQRPGLSMQCALCMLLLSGLAIFAGSSSADATPPHPIKLAVFDMELEDFSAGAASIGARPEDAAQLHLATKEVRRLLSQSGRYVLVDVGGADVTAAAALRNCNGCDAPIASKLGAEQSFVASVTRVSMTEYTMQFQIRDADTGAVVSSGATDLRIGANYSWSRGAAWLIKNRLLSLQGPG